MNWPRLNTRPVIRRRRSRRPSLEEVEARQMLSATPLYVLGTKDNLWLEAPGWQQHGRTLIDSNVQAFTHGFGGGFGHGGRWNPRRWWIPRRWWWRLQPGPASRWRWLQPGPASRWWWRWHQASCRSRHASRRWWRWHQASCRSRHASRWWESFAGSDPVSGFSLMASTR
jgi:hypothetical protein